jgi:hypothetical protein
MSMMTDMRVASLLELEEPSVQLMGGDVLQIDLPECSFDSGTSTCEEADGWSWSSAAELLLN